MPFAGRHSKMLRAVFGFGTTSALVDSRIDTRKRILKMTDNKSKRGEADRRKVATGEGYEVSYFARKHGISKEQAEGLIRKIGNDREKLNAAAAKLK